MRRPPAVGSGDGRFADPVYGRLYLTLQWLRGRPVGRLARQLQEWQQLDRLDFDRLCEARLRRILAYARSRTPLYRSTPWREALEGRGDRLRDWPVLERDVLRERFDELRAMPPRPWQALRRSSASTGEPVRVALNPKAAAWGWACEYRAGLWHGIPIGVQALKLWGETNGFLDTLRHQKAFLTTELTPPVLDAALDFLRRRRPPLIIGQPSAVARLARHARDNGVVGPLAAFAKVGGEQLFGFERAEIETWLARRVVNFYGCTEVGAVAAECPEGSFHVCAEHVKVEVLRGDEPVPAGEFGDLVLTSLTNRAMPIVRVRNGDRGRLAPDRCRCGRPHPILLEVQARAGDVFLGSDGEPRHASELVARLETVFEPIGAGPRQVLFGQVDPLHWTVWVEAPAADAGAWETLADRVRRLVRQTFGPECRVETRLVQTIPRERSGKYRYYRVEDPSGPGDPIGRATSPEVLARGSGSG